MSIGVAGHHTAVDQNLHLVTPTLSEAVALTTTVPDTVALLAGEAIEVVGEIDPLQGNLTKS